MLRQATGTGQVLLGTGNSGLKGFDATTNIGEGPAQITQ
jgi:hypothetical protein